MTGVICSVCGGNMDEDMQTGDLMCDCCGIIVRYNGTEDHSFCEEDDKE